MWSLIVNFKSKKVKSNEIESFWSLISNFSNLRQLKKLSICFSVQKHYLNSDKNIMLRQVPGHSAADK